MAARHRKFKPMSPNDQPEKAGGNPMVFRDAGARKKGGKVIGKVHGHKPKARMDKPGRKNGGRIGSNETPFSTARRVSSASKSPD